MAINMDRYVRIVSSVSGASAVAQQSLTGRRFSTSPLVPFGSIVTVGPGGADEHFGALSPEAAFARQYFSYVSPAPASQAPDLQFAPHVDVARVARVYGAKHKSLAALKAITAGALTLVVDGVEAQIDPINLSAAVSLADVATAVSSAIALDLPTGPTIAYDAVNARFVATSQSSAGPETISFGAPISGSDVAAAMGLDVGIVSPGADAQTMLEAFIASEGVTDSFGSVSWPTTFEDSDVDSVVPVAEYVAAANVKYQAYWSVDDLAAATAFATALGGTASNGIILNSVVGEYKEAIPQAVMSATDYDRVNAAVNYMFRQPGVTMTPDVKSNSDADAFDALRTNYYGQTASAGQNISFFQRGVLCGPATAPLDMSVHANEQWLKARLKSDLMSLLLTTGRIPANNDGRGYVLSVVQGGVNQAIVNGTILTGKTLTDLQKVAISSGSGDPLAWHDVQTNGYWINAQVTQETDGSGFTTHVVKYTLFYSKGDSVRKIEGSHNLV